MLGNRKSEYIHNDKMGATKRPLRAVFCYLRCTNKLTVPVLAMTGWLAMSLPSTAVTATYRNDFRVCSGRLLSVGITAEAASQACATALRPSDLSSCVSKIERQTQIAAVDALSSCRQVRRPEELATCVVGISLNTQEGVNSTVLNYCSRSLLPVRFAQCVVGLRAEIDLAPTQVMDSCIDASDKITGFLPSFIPATTRPTEFGPIEPIRTPQPTTPPPPTTPDPGTNLTPTNPR